jgi:hypothetical protein
MDPISPGRGRAVHFRDGNRLNLRRSNLEVRGGRAKGQSARLLAEPVLIPFADSGPYPEALLPAE